MADHLGCSHDLDIEARRVADEVGLAFGRTASLNAEPAVMAALADLVVAATPPEEAPLTPTPRNRPNSRQ